MKDSEDKCYQITWSTLQIVYSILPACQRLRARQFARKIQRNVHGMLKFSILHSSTLLKNFPVQRTLSLRAKTRRRSRLFYLSLSDFTTDRRTRSLANRWPTSIIRSYLANRKLSSLSVDDTLCPIEQFTHALLFKRNRIAVFARESWLENHEYLVQKTSDRIMLNFARKADGSYHNRRHKATLEDDERTRENHSWQKITNIIEFCNNLNSIDNYYDIFMIILIKFSSHRENIVQQ